MTAVKRLSFQLLGPFPSNAENLFSEGLFHGPPPGAPGSVYGRSINYFNIARYSIDTSMNTSCRALARRVLEPPRVNAPLGLPENRELRAAGILQVASETLPLALGAGGGNEEPVRDGDREQQRCDAFEQLPTCTHANLF